MQRVITSEQMRDAEQAAIRSGRVTEARLMDRAGYAIADAVQSRWGGAGPAGNRAVVLCGPGNNGGDGFVTARILFARGWNVEVWELSGGGERQAAAAEARESWLASGTIRPLEEFEERDAPEGTVAVDALFGTGLSRPVPPVVCRALAAGLGGGRLVAADILSCISADTGRLLASEGFNPGPAALTVTFQWAKHGHVLGHGAVLAGELLVASIGLEPEARQLEADRRAPQLYEPSAERLRVLVGKSALRHKYEHGHVMVVSGGPGKGGAARLAARGALRVGAGLVTVGSPPTAMAEHAAQLNAIMLEEIASAAKAARYSRDRRVSAACLGPGMGVGDRTKRMVRCMLGAGFPVVLDADALTAYERDPEQLFDMLRDDCVLTPHMGEFGRLFPEESAEMEDPLARSKIDAVRAAAERSGAVVLLKGHDSVIADPAGGVRVVASAGGRSAPWLATAGSGDVLAGIVTGLLARGAGPAESAACGAWLHAEAARMFGPGLVAEDLPEALPGVLRGSGL